MEKPYLNYHNDYSMLSAIDSNLRGIAWVIAKTKNPSSPRENNMYFDSRGSEIAIVTANKIATFLHSKLKPFK